MLTKIVPHPGNRLFKTVTDMTDALVGNYAVTALLFLLFEQKNTKCISSAVRLVPFINTGFFFVLMREESSYKWQEMFPVITVNLISF